MINNPVLSLAIIFILGFFSSRLIKELKIPVITAYVALGIILSPNLLNLISPEFLATSGFFSDIVLGIIAFSLGESFSLANIKGVGKTIMVISLTASLFPWLFVTLGVMFLFKQPFYVALLLGAIASATDPATTVLVSQEYRAKGRFTDILLGIVAVDDLWALMVFGFSLSFARSFIDGGGSSINVFMDVLKAFWEIIGSFILGGAAAVLFNKFSHLINSVKERLIYTLGFLFLVIGLAISFRFSILLSSIFFGTVLVNKNNKSFEYFNSLREIDAPLYLIFFVLAGASLKSNLLPVAFLVIIAFILFRIIGKVGGAFLGAKLIDDSSDVKKYMGLALIPQAGVALACALIAKHAIGGTWGDRILTITIASTVFFELIGPWATRFSLVKSGDIKDTV